MPPKKVVEEERVVLLGRPGNNVKMGIVGLPNVGKSSFFNVLCDERFDFLCKNFHPKSEVPAVLSVTDIAGLVKGASEGAGLGNAFLSHIQAVDGLFHMCRGFTSDDVTHVEGTVDPVRDLEIIHHELHAKDMATLSVAVEAARKGADRGSAMKEKKAELECLLKAQAVLAAGRDIRAETSWTGHEIELLNTFQFLTAKPMIYLVNLSEKAYVKKASKWLAPIAAFVEARGVGDKIIPFSVEFEAKLLGEDGAKVAADAGAASALPRIVRMGYKTLNLIHFFTCGEDEVIHTDFEKGFICADIYAFEDYREHGSEVAIKAAGRMRMEGRKYLMQDGDCVLFKFSAPSGGGKKKDDS